MNLSEPPLGRIYQEIGKTSGQEQSRFELYTSARVMDNNSYKKTCKKEFRKYLHDQDWFRSFVRNDYVTTTYYYVMDYLNHG